MEYILQLEERKRYWLLGIAITFIFLFIIFSNMLLGIYGFALSTGVVLCFLLTPLLYGRYKLFLFLWLVIVPFFDNFRPLLIGSTSLVTYFITGLSFPVAFILIYKELGNAIKELPFLIPLCIFELVMIINFFRPGTPFMVITELLRCFIAIFIIICTYNFLKKNSTETLFNWINIFVVINSLTAIFQRLTGIGMRIIEGIPRVQGFLGHPNVTGFVINIFLPVCIYMFLNSKVKKTKIYWGISILINTLALLLTFTKVCYFTFAVTMLILFFYLPFKIKFRVFFGVLASSIIFLILNSVLDLKIIESMVNRIDNTTSYMFRLRIWHYILSVVNLNNVWFGHGINSVQLFLTNLNELARAHNIYVQLLYEYGITCIFFYLTFIIPFIKFFKYQFIGKIYNKFIYIFPILTIIGIFLNMYSDNSILIRTPLYYALVVITIFYLKFNNINNLSTNDKKIKTIF